MKTNKLEMNIGDVHVHKPFKFKFILTAEDSPVRLTSISAGCASCTVVETKKFSLEANESVDLDVTFTPDKLGEQVKFIHIQYIENEKSLKTSLKFYSNVIK